MIIAKPEELEKMDSRALLEEKLRVDTEIRSFDQQIAAAKHHFATTGEYADWGWYRRAAHARRVLGQYSQALQVHIGLRRRAEKAARHAEKAARHQAHEAVFQRALRALLIARLGEDEYSRLCVAANREALGAIDT